MCLSAAFDLVCVDALSLLEPAERPVPVPRGSIAYMRDVRVAKRAGDFIDLRFALGHGGWHRLHKLTENCW